MKDADAYAALMAGLNLARDLFARGIAVVCLHPGSVRTQMTQGLADTTTVGMLVDCEVAARGLIAASTEDDRPLVSVAREGELDGPTAWLFGNEARGLTDEQLGLADREIEFADRIGLRGGYESRPAGLAISI